MLHSETLIDLCLTTAPEKISFHGVIRTGVSDHDIIYVVRKLNHIRAERHRAIHRRCMKHFNQERFVNDLGKVPWDSIQDANPNHNGKSGKNCLFLLLMNTLLKTISNSKQKIALVFKQHNKSNSQKGLP